MQTDTNDIPRSIRDAVSDGVARAAAMGALGGIALIHVLQSPEAFAETGYLGALFIAAIVTSLVIAAALGRTSDSRAWAAAGALPAVILLGYVLSRTSGLPDATVDVDNWTEPLGLASMVVEGFLVFLTVAVLATRPQAARVAVPRPVEARGRQAHAA